LFGSAVSKYLINGQSKVVPAPDLINKQSKVIAAPAKRQSANGLVEAHRKVMVHMRLPHQEADAFYLLILLDYTCGMNDERYSW
jgi:hypothetical protein